MKPLLSIIIVKYKSVSFLKGCLESLGKSRLREIIVVDNDKNNIGYGAGCNLGAKKAQGKYLLFLNPDTFVLPGAVQKMIDFIDSRTEVAMVGPRLYLNLKKEKQLSFCRFPDPLTSIFVFSPIKSLWPDNPLFRRYVYFDNHQQTQTREVDAVSGAAILVRKDYFERVGGFDEKFFLYFEENDLCCRIKDRGGKVYFYPQAEVLHFGGGSLQDQTKIRSYFRQSRFNFFKKHYFFPSAFLTEAFIRVLEWLAELGNHKDKE